MSTGERTPASGPAIGPESGQHSASDERVALVQRMCAVTVSRMYGSGGGEVAARLARQLGWSLIDHEVVVRVAHELGITEQEAAEQDERSESFISRALHSMSLAYPPYPGVMNDVPPPPSPAERERGYHDALRRVIELAAKEGHTVIVGRGSHMLLGKRRDVLKVRVVAPLEQRVAYVARREGLSEREARDRIHDKDTARVRYVESTYHIRFGDPDQYDLTINTGILSLDDAVDLARLALERKARRLDAPESELGPGAGLQRYAGTTADVPLPDDAAGSSAGNSE